MQAFAWTERKKEERAEFQDRMKREAAEFLALKKALSIKRQRTVQKGNSHSESRI